MTDLIVIGAGPGGYEAAAHAGQMGKKVILFERENIGGTCLNVGCIPTKTLLKSAHTLSHCKSADKYGVTSTGASLSMDAVQQRKAKVISTLTKGIEGLLKKSGVELIRAQATIIGPGKIEANGQTFETSNILIATGSKPATPPIPGIDSPCVLDSTALLNLQTIPESLVIVGGGVIGLEFDSFFSEVGSKVTVIEMLPNIAGALDIDMAKRLLMALKKKGITFFLNARVQKIDGNRVHFTDETGANQQVDGAVILNATGRRPVMDGLGLDQVGVIHSPKGIVADEQCKTNVEGIWACGDVTGRLLLAHAATQEGRVAVENMFGGNMKMNYPAIPSVVYTNPEVASVGYTEEQIIKMGIPYKKSITPMGVAGRFLIEYEGESGTIKVLVSEANQTILGVHMVGGPCGEQIYGAAMMIEGHMTVSDLKNRVFPHPTISEALKEAILHAV